MVDLELHEYGEVLGALEDGRRTHLLLGNGFSIDCDPVFRYERLYDAALAGGLSERAQQVFNRLGTNNFEGAMRLLDDADWVAREYGLLARDVRSDLQEDVEIIKQALVTAVGTTHLRHTGEVSTERKAKALGFLERYHHIFCVNYDLLLYWVVMADERGPHWQDGFRADEGEPDAAHLVFTERMGDRKGIFFIHGALHLYESAGEVRKHSWIRTGVPLTDSIRAGLAAGNYPIFVAEGSAEKKIQQIRESGYLSYCLGKLGRIQHRLVIFGHSLGPSDRHVVDTIAHIADLRELWISLYGGSETAASRGTQAAAALIEDARRELGVKELTIRFFDSASAHVWRD